ncbi:MAG: hypothetical protein Q9160_000473 [Pyrenula sp. 1 TL-2023]
MHKHGYSRIVGIPDPLTTGNFGKLFDSQPFNPIVRSFVEGALGAPAKYGVASWQELKVPPDVDPNSVQFKLQSEENRKKSNLRIYCDNDGQSPNGGTRWRLYPDRPRERWDDGYVPNSRRSRFDAPFAAEPFQVWVDDDNGLQTIHSGCQNQGMLAYTHNDIWKSLPDQPAIRTVVTFLHANPHKIPDQRATLPGSGPGRLAYTWPELLHLPSLLKLQNVNNYAYFSLLATIRDRKWRLAPEEADWRMGKIVHDESITRRSSTASLKDSCNDDNNDGSGWSNGKACIEFEG